MIDLLRLKICFHWCPSVVPKRLRRVLNYELSMLIYDFLLIHHSSLSTHHYIRVHPCLSVVSTPFALFASFAVKKEKIND